MYDIVLELLRLFVIAFVFAFLIYYSNKVGPQEKGARWILLGFGLIFFGASIDVTDNFSDLNRFIVIGDTPYQAFLEKVVGYLLGYIFIAIGFWQWLPTVLSISDTNNRLRDEIHEHQLTQKKLKQREASLRDYSTQLEEKNLELVAAKEIAVRYNELQGHFMANVSHEIRTPMHAILAFSSLGIEKAELDLEEKYSRYFNQIFNSAERLNNLTDDLLKMTNLEAGKIDLKRELLDMVPVVQEAIHEQEARLRKAGFEWELVTPEVDTHGYFDPGLILRVLHNLISNAVNHADKGKKLRIAFESYSLTREHGLSTPMPAVILSLRDWGSGIPDDSLEVIFDKFTQTSKSKPGISGTGMGLAICKEIMELHGGKIWAENHSEGGAVFTIALPATDATIPSCHSPAELI